MTAVLCVSGSDSGGGAGLQADLRTLQAYGVHGLTALTAVTAQTSKGVSGSWAVPVQGVRAQLSAAAQGFGLAAVKSGMLATAAAVHALADWLVELGPGAPPLVLDPVLASSSGDPLLEPDGVEALTGRLLPLATVVTPNLAEAQALTGVTVTAEEDLAPAAAALLALGPRWVYLTGGHLPGEAVDLLTDGDEEHVLRSVRLPVAHTRGTGCTLAAALAAGLAQGDDVPTAARRAKGYVTGAIAGGFAAGPGAGVLDHAWQTR